MGDVEEDDEMWSMCELYYVKEKYSKEMKK